MAAQTTIVSVSTTAATADWPTWSDNVMVDAGVVPAADVVYVTTDGSVASASNFNIAIQGGQEVIVPNRQPKLNGLHYAGNGGLDELPQKNGYGITSQTVPASLWGTGFPTYISLVCSAVGQYDVGVEQR